MSKQIFIDVLFTVQFRHMVDFHQQFGVREGHEAHFPFVCFKFVVSISVWINAFKSMIQVQRCAYAV